MILLDVVIRADDSGLRLGEYIRDELQSRRAHPFCYRTAAWPCHSGHLEYDIGDWRSRTDLEKMLVTLISACRTASSCHQQPQGPAVLASWDIFNASPWKTSCGFWSQLTSITARTTPCTVRLRGLAASGIKGRSIVLATTGPQNSVELPIRKSGVEMMHRAWHGPRLSLLGFFTAGKVRTINYCCDKAVENFLYFEISNGPG